MFFIRCVSASASASSCSKLATIGSSSSSSPTVVSSVGIISFDAFFRTDNKVGASSVLSMKRWKFN